ncbi:MAG: YjgP/YjgQ family permease [Chitinophagaceae bacterium]|nr:MAG: YjgP/YjgQ family permease [Chitinophagaceae bacterium]
MKLLDWYILKKFLSTTIFMVLIFSLISVVIDTSEKTDEFVKSGLSAYTIITQYYFGFVPFIISLIFPLMVFIAVILFTSKMAGRSEIIAILAGGVSFNRLLRSYLYGAIIFGGGFWLANHLLIPKAVTLYGNFQSKYIDSESSYEKQEYYKKRRDYYYRLDTNTYAGMRNYDSTTKMARSGFFMERIKDGKVVYNLRADNIRWDTAKKNWQMSNVVERKLDGVKEKISITQTRNIDLSMRPDEIEDKYLKGKMTTPTLVSFIEEEESKGSEGLSTYKVERYRRDATSFSVFLLTMMGAMIGARKVRGGSGLHMAVGIVIAALFVVMDKFSLTFSTKSNFPPLLAAWTPNLIFSIVTLFIYRNAPK